MPVYAMNSFKLPKSICEQIDKIMANYWWNSQQDRSSTHWVAWDRMKYLKKEGDLGFRDIEKFNDALLAKQAWRILQNPECLMARTLKGRYFSKTNILNASRGTLPSFGWQSILHGQNLLKKGLRYTVGNGRQIHTWVDPWLPVHPPRPPRHLGGAPIPNHTVTKLFLPYKTGWNEVEIRNTVHPDDVSLVLSIKLSPSQNKDFLGWHYTETGTYTVKSGYWLATHFPDEEHVTRPPHGNPIIKQGIWKTHLPPKLKHFLWRMLSRALATGDEMEKRHIHNDRYCKRCVTEVETTEHLFFNCPHAMQIWRASNIPLRSITNSQVTLERKIKEILEYHKHKGIYDLIAQLPIWIMWKIWRSRNQLIFQKKNNTWQKDLREARQEAEEWLTVDTSKRTTQIQTNNGSLRRRGSNTG